MRTPKRRGFTLIELLIVISLIVTLTGLATTGFIQSYRARSVDHFTKELTAYLRYLQFKAIEEGAVHKLILDPETGSLTSFVQDSDGKKFRKISTSFSRRFEKSGIFSTLLDPTSGIYFFPDGNVTKSKLWVMSGSEKKAAVEIKNRIGAFQVTTYG